MKKFLVFLAAASCAMALSATTYTCHLKVNVNGYVTEQDQVPVEIINNNGTFDLSLMNFVLISGSDEVPVGTIAVSGVEGQSGYGYTSITYNEPLFITAGNDPKYDYWLGPMLGAVPVNMDACFIDAAVSANIEIVMGDMVISVDIFGVAPVVEGDVNKDSEVNIADVNSVIDLILK